MIGDEEKEKRRRRRSKQGNSRDREAEEEKGIDVAFLLDLVAADDGDGGGDAAVLRRAGRAPLRPLHRGVRLVLLPFHHHPRSTRHLDCTTSLLLFLIFFRSFGSGFVACLGLIDHFVRICDLVV